MFKLFFVGEKIREKVKKDKEVIYGGQAMNEQLPIFFRRKTNDYDIYSKTPRKRARELDRKLDNRENNFYTKPALHPGTWRVMHVGFDGKPKTRDDIGIADYSKPTREIKTVKIGGIRYAHLSERKRDAIRSLQEQQYSFRHDKDRGDLKRINDYRKLQRSVY